jgi:hypothetical protein
VIRADVIYDDLHGHYVAYFADAGDGSTSGWYRWPAEAGGWRRRTACTMPTEADRVYELPGPNAYLALVLSGAPDV